MRYFRIHFDTMTREPCPVSFNSSLNTTWYCIHKSTVVVLFGLIPILLFYQLRVQPATRKTVTFKMIFARNLETIATSFVYSFPIDYYFTLPQFVGLFRNLLNHVSISAGTWPITSNLSVTLFGWTSSVCWVFFTPDFSLTIATAFESLILLGSRMSL